MSAGYQSRQVMPSIVRRQLSMVHPHRWWGWSRLSSMVRHPSFAL